VLVLVSSTADCLWSKDDPGDFQELAKDTTLDRQGFVKEKRRTFWMWSMASLPDFPPRFFCKLCILSVLCKEVDGFDLVSIEESFSWEKTNCVSEDIFLVSVSKIVPVSSTWDNFRLIGDF
jgi:hypothetical protein